MSDTSNSSSAILRALLALSSLHMKGDAAFAYQAKAVSLLSASLKETRYTEVAFQNIAASMLLCTYEVWAILLFS